MRNVLLFLVIAVVLCSVVSAETSLDDLKNKLSSRAELAKVMAGVNEALDSVPASVKALIGTDRVYHVRISTSSLGLIIKDGRITGLFPGTPANPTHYADTSYDVALKIANSDSFLATQIGWAILRGDIRITKVPLCKDDSSCNDNEVCTSKGCVDAYTIAVVPLGYGASEYNDFYSKAKPEIDLLENYLPMDSDYLRVHYVDPKVCPNMQCKDVHSDCQNTARECARRAGLLGAADKVAGVSKGDVITYYGGQSIMLCGCAGGIPSYTSVSRSRLYVGNGVYCYNTVPHEMGHQLGLYHVDATGEEAGACMGPNANDCKQSNKKSDIMGYDWPQDHFGPAARNYLQTNVLKNYQG